MSYYIAIERDPDRKLRLGVIDEDGERMVVYYAPTEQAVREHLQRRAIEAEVHEMPAGYRPHRPVDVNLVDGAVNNG